MKNRSRSERGLIATGLALIQLALRKAIGLGMTTSRTLIPIWPAQMKKVIMASLFVDKSTLKFHKVYGFLLHCLFSAFFKDSLILVYHVSELKA